MRRMFLGFIALAGARLLKGQQVIYHVPVSKTESMYPPDKYKPKNGECPVCGTMAPEFKAQPIDASIATPAVGVWPPPKIQVGYAPGFASTRMTRCAHCNNAFFQDAE